MDKIHVLLNKHKSTQLTHVNNLKRGSWLSCGFFYLFAWRFLDHTAADLDLVIYYYYLFFFIVSVTRVLAQSTCSSRLLVQNVNNQSGLIQSSIGSSYSSNMNCSWTIRSNAKLELAFVGPFKTGRNTDFVYVYDGSSSSARLIGRFSGSSRPGTIVSSSNQLHVRFTSDASSQYHGFKAVYRGKCFVQLRPCP